MFTEPSWERQPNEPSLWFHRFTFYRLAGSSRSILECVNVVRDTKGHRRTHNTPSSWRKAAKQWHWKERAEAWDADERHRLVIAQEQARDEMIRRHIEDSLKWQKSALECLEGEGIKSGSLALKAWKASVNEERKARGLPSEVLEILTMTKDELFSRYRDLLEKIGDAGSRDQTARSPTAETEEGQD